MKFITNPFCPTCGSIRPENNNSPLCIPCFNKGHYYRLITDESDRLRSFTNWLVFWSNQDFTKKQIEKIPTYINLTKYTFSKIHYLKSKKEY